MLKRNVLYLSVKVFSTKVVIRDNILSYCKTLSIGPTPGIEPRPSAGQSRALPIELILPRLVNIHRGLVFITCVVDVI